jgi:hypothetical protein
MKKRERNLPLSEHNFLQGLPYTNCWDLANQNSQAAVAQFPVSPSTDKNQARGVVLRAKASYRQVSCRLPKQEILMPNMRVPCGFYALSLLTSSTQERI